MQVWEGNISLPFFSVFVETTAPERPTALCGGLDNGLWLPGDPLGALHPWFLVLKTHMYCSECPNSTMFRIPIAIMEQE